MIEWLSNFIPNSAPGAAVFCGTLVTWALLPIIIFISHKKNLFDEPTGVRKLHSDLTPNLGGVAFYFSIMTIFSISGYAFEFWTPYLYACLTILLFSGVKDDIFILSARTKLIFQILVACIFTLGADLVITNLGGVFGFNQIPYWFGVLLTMFTVVVVINAYNLIDGIDGLAGSIGLISCLFFAAWFWTIGYAAEAVLAFICAGSLLGFLWFNFNPASVFMGDTGSQIMGLMLAFFAVSFVKIGVTATGYVPFQNEIPVLVLAVLIVPLYDTLRVFTLRLFRKGSPFKADRLHVHHQLMDVGFSDKATCYLIVGLNLFIISLTLLLGDLNMNINVLLGVVLLTSGVLFPTSGFKRLLLQKAGVTLPSVRRIRILERKYGFNTGIVDEEKIKNQSEGEKDWEKVAV